MQARAKALVMLGIFIFMSTLDGSIVNIALPTLSHELHVPLSQATWTVIAYLVTLSGLILFFGRLGDTVGKTRVFRVGMVVFTVGSLGAGLNFGLGLPYLLVWRIVQGVGAAMTLSNSFGIVSQMYPVATRGRALSVIAMFTSLGMLAGPALGGLILQIAPWSCIFWINVPLGVFAFLLGNRVLPTDDAGPMGRLDLDWAGALTVFCGIALVLWGLSDAQQVGFSDAVVVVCGVVGLILVGLFLVRERRARSPLLDVGIFSNGLFSLSVATSSTMFMVGMFSSVLLPMYLQELRQLAVGWSGLVMIAYPLGILIFSPVAGVLSDRFDKEVLTVAGISGVIVASVGYVLIGRSTGLAWIVVCLFLHGSSIGFFKSPNNTLVMSNVASEHLGIAGSVNNLGQNVGFVLGTSFATTALFTTMSMLSGRRVTGYESALTGEFMDGLRVGFAIALAFALVAWALSLIRLVRRRRPDPAASFRAASYQSPRGVRMA